MNIKTEGFIWKRSTASHSWRMFINFIIFYLWLNLRWKLTYSNFFPKMVDDQTLMMYITFNSLSVLWWILIQNDSKWLLSYRSIIFFMRKIFSASHWKTIPHIYVTFDPLNIGSFILSSILHQTLTECIIISFNGSSYNKFIFLHILRISRKSLMIPSTISGGFMQIQNNSQKRIN